MDKSREDLILNLEQRCQNAADSVARHDRFSENNYFKIIDAGKRIEEYQTVIKWIKRIDADE